MKHPYIYPTPVEFRISADRSIQTLYLWADFLGGTDYAVEMKRNEAGEFVYETTVKSGTKVKYQVYSKSPIINGKLRSDAAGSLKNLMVEDKNLVIRMDFEGVATVEEVGGRKASETAPSAVEIDEMLDFINRL